MKILKKYDFAPKTAPDERLSVIWKDGQGGEHLLMEDHCFKKMEIFDQALVVEFEDGELGLEHGFGGVIGRKKTDGI